MSNETEKKLVDPMVIDDEQSLKEKEEIWHQIFLRYPDLADNLIKLYKEEDTESIQQVNDIVENKDGVVVTPEDICKMDEQDLIGVAAEIYGVDPDQVDHVDVARLKVMSALDYSDRSEDFWLVLYAAINTFGYDCFKKYKINSYDDDSITITFTKE